MAKLNSESVVVITGASTGIGRATALAFAEFRSRLVLVARQAEKLEEVARECEKRGSRCETRTLDVADEEAMHALGEEIERLAGRIDVWVNNAGVGVIGSFTDVPMENHRRLIETNVIGTMNGAHTALKIFKQQGHGILINMASIGSRVSTPLLASYICSKFAIRGLSHALRQDTEFEGFKNIHVCQVNPSVIDTPAFEHTANYSGKAVKLKFPMASPETVARAIVKLAQKPQPEVFVGPLSSLGAAASTMFPQLTDRMVTWATKYYYFGGDGAKAGSGNLFNPVKDASGADGGWKSGETKQV